LGTGVAIANIKNPASCGKGISSFTGLVMGDRNTVSLFCYKWEYKESEWQKGILFEKMSPAFSRVLQ
jgi:hypothetical protein